MRELTSIASIHNAQVSTSVILWCLYIFTWKFFYDNASIEAIRDLIKFLRRDGDDHEIRRFLGAANIVETDLLPILVQYAHKSELFDLIIRLLVNLTTPALLIYNEQPPTDKNTSQYYLQMLLHLQKYKRAFTDVNIWKIIVDKLANIIQAVSCVKYFWNLKILYYPLLRFWVIQSV